MAVNNDLKVMSAQSITDMAFEVETFRSSSLKEMLKVYDSDHNYIGDVSRLLCHRLGLYHEVVNAFVINEQNKILIQTRKDKLTEVFDLSVGGHIGSEDVDPLTALVREAREELGINLNTSKAQKIKVYKRFGYTNILKPREINNEFRHLFVYEMSCQEEECLKGSFLNRENSEALSYQWMDVENVLSLVCEGKSFDGLQYSIYFLLQHFGGEYERKEVFT